MDFFCTPSTENEKKILYQCFDISNDFICIINRDASVEFFNIKAKEILQLGTHKYKGKNFIQTYLKTARQSNINDVFSTSQAQPSRLKLTFLSQNGNVINIDSTNYPIKDSGNHITGSIIVGKVITNEVKKQTDKLIKSKDKAERANQAKTDFLARVSHEIRTPLNAILGFTEQLLQTNLDKKQLEFVEIIDKSSEHLLSLINDILVLSKIEAHEFRLDKEPFKIEHTVNYVFNTLRVKAKEKNLNFNYFIDKKLNTVLIGDAFRLRQILLNMLNNALKFTQNGYIELKSFVQEQKKGKVYVRFDITDTGMGISRENLKIIFDKFKQADSYVSQNFGGTGLGLTICKNLIDLQNGELSVSSKVGYGTTFTFIIPYDKGGEDDLVNNSSGNIDVDKLKGKKVLLVDDDSVNRLLGRTILFKFMCDITIANNGNEAIEKLKSDFFDIVLLDIHMPDINGTEVATILRHELKNTSTKIIAVTAAVVKEDINKYYECGINDFLIKPYKEINLYHKICKALEIKHTVSDENQADIILQEDNNNKSYNLEALKLIAGSNQSFVNEMLTTFIENTQNTILIFRQFMKEKNWKQIGETAHKILPSFRHLEVHSVVPNLIEIKTKTLVDKNFKGIEKLLEITIHEMQKLIAEINNEIHTL